MPKITQGRVQSATGVVFFAPQKNMPVFTTQAGLLTTAPGGVPFLYGLGCYDRGDNPLPVSFTVIAGALPDGLTLNASTGYIMGIPANNDGSFTFTVRATDSVGFADRTFVIQIENLPPVWVTPAGAIGDDYIADDYVNITLLATDPNGDSVIYTLVDGDLPAGVTLDPATGAITGIVPKLNSDTAFRITVEADDSHGGEVPRTFVLMVSAYVAPPEWETPAGSIGSIQMGKVGILNVLAHTNSPSPITYTVIGGLLPPGLLIDPMSGFITGVPSNVSADTTSTFTMQADDGHANTITRVFSITVLHVNLPPVWVTAPGSLGQVNGGTAFSLQLVATDPDNGPDPLVYALAGGNSLPAGLSLSPSGLISGTAGNQPATTHMILTVSDGAATVNLVCMLQVVYVPPIWITPAGGLGSFPMNSPMSLSLQGTDRAGLPVTFALAPGSALPPGLTLTSAGVISGIPARVGKDTSTSFTVRLDDGQGQGTIDQVFTMTITHMNTPPVWVTPPDTLLGTFPMLSGKITVPLIATDVDGDTLTYSVISGTLPIGLSLNTYTGVISGVAAAVTDDTVFTFTVEVNDGNGGTADLLALIQITHVVRPPVWSTPPGTVGTINMLVPLASPIALVAVDPDGNPLTYSLTSGVLSAGLMLNNDGTITGTPAIVPTDTVSSFTVTADNGKGGKTPQFFMLTVKHVNRPPVWVTQAGNLGTSIMLTPITSIQFSATDPDGGTITYSVVSGALPAGLALSGSGVLSGTPSAVTTTTTYTFSLSATNPVGLSTQQAFTYVVTHVVQPPVWVSPAAGSLGTFPMSITLSAPPPSTLATLVATSPDSLPVSYSVTAGALPAGEGIGGNLLGGYLAAVNADTIYTFTVTAAVDSMHSATRSFSIFVQHVNRPPVFSGGDLGTFPTGSAIPPITVSGTDPDGDTVSYTLASGSPPAGLSFSSGVISGTPSPNVTDSTATFVVNATDGKGGTTPATFTLTAKHLNQAPVWSIRTYPTLVVNAPYSTGIIATDPDNGPSPLSYSLVTGLPPGLSLDATSGSISGTPTSLASASLSGTNVVYDFTASVTDGLAVVSQTFALPCLAASPTFVAPTPSAGASLGYYGFDQPATYGPFVATDPLGDVVTYSVVSSLTPTNGTLVGTTTPGGTFFITTTGVGGIGFNPYTVTISAKNAFNATTTRMFTVLYDAGPVWTTLAGTLSTTSIGAAVNVQLATTSSHSPVTYTSAVTLPAGLSLSSTGLISGTSTAYGAATFTVTAKDAVGITSVSGTFVVNVTALAGVLLLMHFNNGSLVDQTGRHNATDTGATLMTDPFGNANGALFLPSGAQLAIGGALADFSYPQKIWTYEFWFYKAAPMVAGNIFAAGSYYKMSITAAGLLTYAYSAGYISGSATSVVAIPVNTWTHIAMASDGTTVRCFVGGALGFSLGGYAYEIATNNTVGLGFPELAPLLVNFGIDEIRITSNACLYTVPFAPPTAPFPG